MEEERKEATLIQSAVPASRGPLKHFEHTNETSMVRWRGDKAAEIHTPQNALKRVHEVMHARHTDPKSYPGIHGEVMQIIEDCRLHLGYWPWPRGGTPESIKSDAIELVRNELAGKHSGFGDFATKLRACAVHDGLGTPELNPTFEAEHEMFARQTLEMIKAGEHELAAKLVERVFYPPAKPKEDEDEYEYEDASDDEGIDGEPKPKSKIKVRVFGKSDPTPEKKPKTSPMEKSYSGKGRMKIIELEKVEPTQSADAGFRLATSGARLYRPALRRPILSPRLFLKKAPYEPIGVICFDSSGSMEVNEEKLSECCRRAPTAVVGYYEGSDHMSRGNLWVYARDGMRARKTPLTGNGGNAVDGPAMDWMLTFDAPRIMVTDREFCGSFDAEMQKARLKELERLKEIEVCVSFDAFLKAFPPLAV